VWVVVDGDIRADGGELRRLIDDGFEGVDPDRVEVRVDRARGARESFTGRAHGRRPPRLASRADTAFLVQLRIPATLRNRAYPKTYRYPRRATAPAITVRDWRERLLALAAHEAWHVHQFRHGLPRSEVAAERWALRTLQAWRDRGRPRPRPEPDGPDGAGVPIQASLLDLLSVNFP
jgi:hypothetical protein